MVEWRRDSWQKQKHYSQINVLEKLSVFDKEIGWVGHDSREGGRQSGIDVCLIISKIDTQDGISIKPFTSVI